MGNQYAQICKDYAEAIYHRVERPLPPEDFQPNWADQPSRYKIYQQVEQIPLSLTLPRGLASMAEILERLGHPRSSARALTTDELVASLLLAHGTLGQRVDINWNRDDYTRAHYANASYSRGTPSGGGMYPTEIYWVCGSSGPVPPGIYHYDNAHHALALLFQGDVTRQVQAALFDHPAARAADSFLLLSLNFWKNSFKYNSFCYHVVTQDVGALLCSLRLLATGFGSDLPFLFWFQDQPLNTLLGLDTLTESVFAVVPLPSSEGKSAQNTATRTTLLPIQESTLPLVKQTSFQRSREILHFPLVESVHLSALLQHETRPDPEAAQRAGYVTYALPTERVELPRPASASLGKDLATVFQRRYSSFGRFSNAKPLSPMELGTLLFSGSAVRGYPSDLKRPDGSPHFTRLMVFVNSVQGIEPGAYAYDPVQHCLWTIQKGAFAHFLQRHYFLHNYNMEQTGVVVAIVGKTGPMLDVYGNRGYRILNAEVGMVAQGLYMASASLSVGCGAILGFDNVELNRVLGLEGTDERSILVLLLGHLRQGHAGIDLPLV